MTAASTLTPLTSAPAARVRPAWLVTTVLCLCGTMAALQQTLVVPLLPDFPEILDASPDNTSWLVTATLLTGAVATPIVARLADMRGKRRLLVFCLGTMALGSLIAGLAPSLIILIIGRALQGMGTALIPVGISTLRDLLPREKVPGAVALMSATVGIGAGIGLPLSGIVYAHFGWHAIFWLSGTASVALLLALLAVVPSSAARTRGSFDFGGALLLSGGLTCLLLAITKGNAWGWTSEPTILLFTAAIAMIGFWVPYELRVGQPMVDIRTSSRRPVLLTNAASLLVGFSMYCNLLTSTQLLQLPESTGFGFELSVIDAGLAMLPAAAAMVFVSPVSAMLIRSYGGKNTLLVGCATLCVGYALRVFLTDSVWQVIGGSIITSVGTAIAFAAMPTLIMRAVPITETAAANGLNSLVRAVGTSTASAVVAAILTSTVIQIEGRPLPTLDAFKHIYWLAAFAALVGAGIALGIPGRGAAGEAAAHEQARVDLRAEGAEYLLRGRLQDRDGTAVRHAVITVMKADGTPVDWSRADNEGGYSVVLPGTGRYVLITSAEGWAPNSEVVDFTEPDRPHEVTLTRRMSLSGRVTHSGFPIASATLWLTRPTGEVVAGARSDDSGRYVFRMPPTGRYIVTALDAESLRTQSRQVILVSQSTTLDIDFATPDDT